ncbi:4Fe-4S binding protein (plasmid) [Azospirillum melinis]|uniref:4Fe-4S binding protein n=1 Tax=Azospirillum melinis TaxID=328839 RepID=UPI003756BE7E
MADCTTPSATHRGGLKRTLAGLGDWMGRSRRLIMGVQWAVIVIYAVLIVVPTLMPLPTNVDRIWTHVTIFAQFVFWGIWWPGVLLSMILFGRLWCGVLCPEGALSERASGWSLGRAVPRWVTWKGWPFVGFLGTTIYGQMISVYQYPAAVLVILGGSTVAAIATGLTWGRNKRVWCRHLCPVSGVFALVSKLAPVHYRVDRDAWDRWQKPAGGHRTVVNCAPLVPLRTLEGNAQCHMCGRCSGFRDAIALEHRPFSDEIVNVAGREAKPWETALILIGLLGVAGGAFRWTGSSLFIDLKMWFAEMLLSFGADRLLDMVMPWWILTNYPENNDVMGVLDGVALLAFIGAEALLAGLVFAGGLALATRISGGWSSVRFHHLAQALIPISAVGVILGLSMTTVTLLRTNGFHPGFVDLLRAVLLAGATLWSAWLSARIVAHYTASPSRRLLATGMMAILCGLAAVNWGTLFWSL